MSPTADPLDYLPLARWIGRRFAIAHRQPWNIEDYQQEAAAALVAEWPRLQRYDVTVSLIGSTIRRRLIDVLRRDKTAGYRPENRRGTHRRRDQPRPPLPLSLVMSDRDDPDEYAGLIDPTVDVEHDALGRVCDRVDRQLARLPVDRQPRARVICRLIGAGFNLAEIGRQLGVSESRVCQLVREIREAS